MGLKGRNNGRLTFDSPRRFHGSQLAALDVHVVVKDQAMPEALFARPEKKKKKMTNSK